MKRGPGLGKTYPLLNEYSNVKFLASTVDYTKLKTINIESRFWFNKNKENPAYHINNIFRSCKMEVFKQSKFYDKDKIISIAHYPKDYSCKSDNIFISFEFTIFPTQEFSNDGEISYLLTEVTNSLVENVFNKREDIFLTKQG